MNNSKKIILFQAALMLTITNISAIGFWDKVTNVTKNSASSITSGISNFWNNTSKKQKVGAALAAAYVGYNLQGIYSKFQENKIEAQKFSELQRVVAIEQLRNLSCNYGSFTNQLQNEISLALVSIYFKFKK